MNKKHALLMLACCLIPIIGFGLVAWLNLPLNSVVYFAMILFCPLSHIIMMKYMDHSMHSKNTLAEPSCHAENTQPRTGPQESAG